MFVVPFGKKIILGDKQIQQVWDHVRVHIFNSVEHSKSLGIKAKYWYMPRDVVLLVNIFNCRAYR